MDATVDRGERRSETNRLRHCHFVSRNTHTAAVTTAGGGGSVYGLIQVLSNALINLKKKDKMKFTVCSLQKTNVSGGYNSCT